MLGGRKRASSSFGANVRRVGGDIVLDATCKTCQAHTVSIRTKKGSSGKLKILFVTQILASLVNCHFLILFGN